MFFQRYSFFVTVVTVTGITIRKEEGIRWLKPEKLTHHLNSWLKPTAINGLMVSSRASIAVSFS
jgi:hypothetical protein